MIYRPHWIYYSVLYFYNVNAALMDVTRCPIFLDIFLNEGLKLLYCTVSVRLQGADKYLNYFYG